MQEWWINDIRSSISGNKYHKYDNGSLLISSPSIDSDSGNYTCRVSNECGKDSVTYNMLIIGKCS